MGQDPELLRRLLRAKDRMDAASHEEWPVRTAGLEVSGTSAAHFARSFKEAFGVPPHRYLLTRRIERATALLRDTDLADYRRSRSRPAGTALALLDARSVTSRVSKPDSGSGTCEKRHAASAYRAAYRNAYCAPSHRPGLTIAVSEKRRREPRVIRRGLEEMEIL